MGDRAQNMSRAIDMMAGSVDITKISSYYETVPVGYPHQPRFLNAVCEATTSLPPEELLSALKNIECALGRNPSFPNAPRPIDIDILFYGSMVIKSSKLTVPHPRLEERTFVLVPLAEVASNLIHPVSGKTVGEMLRELGRIEGVVKWKETENV